MGGGMSAKSHIFHFFQFFFILHISLLVVVTFLTNIFGQLCFHKMCEEKLELQGGLQVTMGQ